MSLSAIISQYRFTVPDSVGVQFFSKLRPHPQKLQTYLRVLIKDMIADGVRSVIGCQFCELHAKLTQICAGREMPGTVAEYDKP